LGAGGSLSAGGRARPVLATLATNSPLAADVVGARLLGFDVQAVRHLWEAQRLGLGETDTSRVEFPGLSLKEAIETFTEAAYGERLTFEHA
jgi:uncharacterized protein (DUF362 family)